MMNPKTPKSAALAKLRNMVSEMMNEDFHSNKVPKLMALKVTKVGPQVDNQLESAPASKMNPAMDAVHAMKEPMESPLEELTETPAEETAEHDAGTCPTCGAAMSKAPMEAKVTTMTASEPAHVSKLKQLLSK